MDAIRRMIAEDFPHIFAIRAVQDGRVLLHAESGGGGPYAVGCVFKAYVSAMVGVALEKSILPPLDTRIVDAYPKPLPSGIDPKFFDLTLRHTLTKTTGIAWPGPGERLPANLAEVFRLPLQDPPGKEFSYKPDPQILIYLLEELTGTDFVCLTDRLLMRPLGIADYLWERDQIESMRVGTDGLMKLGELYLNRGVFSGMRLFSDAYYEESVRAHSPGGYPERKGYGYYWWIDRYLGVDYFNAAGFGGQILCVVPRMNLTVAVASRMDQPHPENNAVVRNIISHLS